MNASTSGSRVELVDDGEQLGLASTVAGSSMWNDAHPDLRRVGALQRMYACAGGSSPTRIVPESGRDASLAEPLDATREVVLHRLEQRVAVEECAPPSVEEVPFAGEHHRESELVGGLDDFSSRIAPPGWMTAATPAAAAASTPSWNG